MNTPILDVLIGLALTFFLVSIISSGVNEWVAGISARRAKMLENTLRRFLKNDEHRRRFYQHPLINILSNPKTGTTRPSYIPPLNFARAFLDSLPGTEDGKTTTIEDITTLLQKIDDHEIKAALQTFIADAEGSIEKLRTDVARWYNDAMDRLSGWYKRHAQMMIFLISLGVTFVFNVDSISVAKSLWSDPVLREQWTMLAEQTVTEQSDPSINQAMKALRDIQSDIFPIGQSPVTTLQRNGIWNTLLGWILTACAASLGAPFWFELVNKLVNLRASGKRPEDTKNNVP